MNYHEFLWSPRDAIIKMCEFDKVNDYNLPFEDLEAFALVFSGLHAKKEYENLFINFMLQLFKFNILPINLKVTDN